MELNKKRMVLGLGSGRCGTRSLAMVLDAQPSFTCTHEAALPLPWIRSYPHFKLYTELIYNTYPNSIVGDVAFYILNYVELVIQMLPNTKFICLKRDRNETIRSHIKMSERYRNSHVNEIGGKHWESTWSKQSPESVVWRESFPHYDLPRKLAFGKYYDDYYAKAEELQNKFPSFKIFDMNEVLNTQSGQEKLFDHIELIDRFYLLNIQRKEK